MKRSIFTTFICLLLVAVTVLVSCNDTTGNGTMTQATTVQQATSAETTAGTTVGTTLGTTAATTGGEDDPVGPVELVPEVKRANINKVLAHLDTPFTVEIHDGVTISLNYQGWPTICKGEGDTIYAVSSVRIQHVDIFGAIGFTKSTDGGKTWEPMRLIKDTPLDDRDAGIVDLGDGHLMATWFTHNASLYREGATYGAYRSKLTTEQKKAVDARLDALTAEQSKGAAYVMHSLDGGETWGDPIAVPIQAPHGATLMQDGKSLVFLGLRKGTLGNHLDSKAFHMYISTDGGYTWDYQSSLTIPSDVVGACSEAHIIQLQDGSFLASFRHDNDTGIYTYTSRSTDGKRWTPAERLATGHGAPPHLLQLSSGAILLSYAWRGKGECSIRGSLSYDGGKTWGEEFIISEAFNPNDGDHGYPSTVELEDGTLITAYYQKYLNSRFDSFLYTKWNLVPAEA